MQLLYEFFFVLSEWPATEEEDGEYYEGADRIDPQIHHENRQSEIIDTTVGQQLFYVSLLILVHLQCHFCRARYV